MAQLICEFSHSIGKCDCKNGYKPNCTWKDIAKTLLDAGYRKIDKNFNIIEKEITKKILKNFADTFPKEKGISSSHAKIHRYIDEIAKQSDIEIKEIKND